MKLIEWYLDTSHDFGWKYTSFTNENYFVITLGMNHNWTFFSDEKISQFQNLMKKRLEDIAQLKNSL